MAFIHSSNLTSYPYTKSNLSNSVNENDKPISLFKLEIRT